MRARWACQTASEAGSLPPIACVSVSAAMGCPGNRESSRISASARVGARKARRPRHSVASAAPAATTSETHAASSGRWSCTPKDRAESVTRRTVQNGQKHRVSRSAHIPSSVSRSGRERAENVLS